jgi:hypothetical protein
LSTNLRLVLASDLFPSGFPINIVYAFSVNYSMFICGLFHGK